MDSTNSNFVLDSDFSESKTNDSVRECKKVKRFEAYLCDLGFEKVYVDISRISDDEYVFAVYGN